MKIVLPGKVIGISFDTTGNVYFTLDNTTYEILIDRANKISCEKCPEPELICPDNSDNKLLTGNLMELDESSLKKRIENEEKTNSDDEYEEKTGDIIQQNYPENNEFDEIINVKQIAGSDSDEEIDGPNEIIPVYFAFSSVTNSDISKLVKYIGDDTPALYDTLLYEESSDKEQIQLIGKTTMVNDTPMYRLNISSNGKITFRPIGYKLQEYILEYNQETQNLQIV